VGFSRAAWDLPEDALAARLGIAPVDPQPPLHDLLAPLLSGADQRDAAAAYAGLWAVFIASPGGRGRLFGYANRIEAVPGARALRQETADADSFHAHGSLIAFGAKLFRLAQDARRHDAVSFFYVSGVASGRAAILEGFAVAHGSGVEAAPAASPILLLRLADTVTDASFAAARDVASRYNEQGWESSLPEPLLARFRIAEPVPPAPTILRRPLSDCWATKVADLNEPAMADRRAALEAVRKLYAPT
jgi:hypothetical protein